MTLQASFRMSSTGSATALWMASNVVMYEDEKRNVLPKKDKKKPHLKVDGFIAAVMCNARRMSGAQVKTFEYAGM